jgi:hypothetical protein
VAGGSDHNLHRVHPRDEPMTSSPTILERWAVPRRLPLHAWAWLAPVVAALCAYYRPNSLSRLIAAIVALALIIVVARHPAAGLLVLVPLLAFQHIVLSLLYRLGVPAGIVGPLGGVKEAILGGVLVAAVQAARASHRRFDVLDKLAALYVLAVTAYLLFPRLLVSGAGLPGTKQTLHVRALSFRADVFFVLLLLAARHAPIDARARRRFVQVALGTAVVVAGVAVYEFFFSSQWNDFAVSVLRVLRYKAEVLHVPPVDPTDIRFHGVVGSRDVIRVGSVLFEPVPLAFYLLIGLGLTVAVVGTRQGRPAVAVGAALIAAALILTLTRSAVLSALVVAFVLVSPSNRAGRRGRVRLALLLIAALVLAAPVAAGSGLASRARGNDDRSGAAHIDSVDEGFAALRRQPLGFGLGAEPGIGDRFSVPTKLTSHDAYLQVGNELGIPTMLLFIALIVMLLVTLRRAESSDEPGFPLAHALFAVGVGLAVGGLLQHVWLELPLAWTFWAGAGLAIGAADRRREAWAEERGARQPISPSDHLLSGRLR